MTELLKCQRSDGTWIWIETLSSPIGDETGRPIGFVTNLRDVTRRKIAEDELAEMAAQLAVEASTDALTGLANRREFSKVLKREWRRAIREETWIALLMVDVDYFKSYNDLAGHVAGDGALRKVAECIDANIRRPGDIACRYGGEEFAIILPRTDVAGAYHLAEIIRCAIGQAGIAHPERVGGKLTVSIGVASIAPVFGMKASSLIQLADSALYQSKLEGRDQTTASDPCPSQKHDLRKSA